MKREKKLEVLTVEKINTIEEYYQSNEKTICHLTVAGGRYILTLDDISCIKSNEVEKWPIKKIDFDTSKKELAVALIGIDFKNNVEDYYFHFKEDELFFNVHKQYQEIEKQSQMEKDKAKAAQQKEAYFQEHAKKDWKFRLSLLAITACFAAFLTLFKMSGQMTTSFLYTAIEWMPFYFVSLWIETAFHLQRNKRYTKMFALLQIVISTLLLGILYISNQQVALSYVIFFMMLILPSIIYLWKNKKEKLQSAYTLGAKTWGLTFVLVAFGPFLLMQYLPNFKHHQGSSSFVDYSTLYFILICVLCGYVVRQLKSRLFITYFILLLASSSVLFFASIKL